MSDPQHDVTAVAARLGLPAAALTTYGRDKAKIDPAVLGPLGRNGKLVLVSGITPTPAGEGKTTTSIGLADGLTRLGRRACVVLREPSLGPIFGQKGVGTGFGRSRVVPTADINLHFTGDFHAITSAHNLLSAMVDNHLHHGLAPALDPARVTWRRTLDMNDRAIRQIEIGRGKGAGPVRSCGYDITAASEIMAILALASDPADLRARLSRIVVGRAPDGTLVTAGDIRAVGGMMALLRDAIRPNLVATVEGTPALIHCGPFANIAHGTASVAALRLAQHAAEVAVVEAGFGFDLGGEKFFDLVAHGGPLSPAAVVLVVSLRALRHHGGAPSDQLQVPSIPRVVAGMANLVRHLENVERFGRPVIIALNAFPGDSHDEVETVHELASHRGDGFAVIDATTRGAEGGVALAQAVLDRLGGPGPGPAPMLYGPGDSLRDKVAKVATTIYRARAVVWSAEASAQADELARLGFGELPVCMAKTPASFTDDATRPGAPDDHELTVRRLELAAGAGFVVVLCGAIVRMPGLPREPRATAIDLVDGHIVGIE